jgi:hypothetical protein
VLLSWSPEVLRSAGLQCIEVAGCYERSHGDFGDRISGVWHHDASPTGPSPGALDWMVSNWNNASANFWVDLNGVWYLVGVGASWHAGSVRAGMPNNFNSFGVETDHTINETYSDHMLECIRRGFAALLGHMGVDAMSLHFHKTIASPVGRKSDPWFDSRSNDINYWNEELYRERNAVQDYMDGITSSPTPIEEDDDMLKVLRNKEGFDYVYGPNFFDRIDNEDEYFFYYSAGLINVPHGQATVVDQNLIDFVEAQVRKNQHAV